MGLKNSKLVREAATLVSGNALAQVITLAAYFVLTRIYTPDDYGLFNIFYSYIEVLIIFSTCKYELAIVVADDEREASAVAHFALRLNAVVAILLLTVALALWLTGALPGNFALLGWMVLLIPPMVFFCGTSRVYSFLYNRFHRYTMIAVSDSVNASVGAATKIVLGLVGFLHSGLPLGTVIGRAVANINYRLQMHNLSLPKATVIESKSAAQKHRNFPFFVASKDLVNTFASNLPFLWAAIYFDRTEVGLFGLALTFTLQPVNILSAAFERVLYARTAEAVRERQPVMRLQRRFLFLLLVVALPVCVLAWFIAEPLFVFCFGDRWQGCGTFVQALLPLALTGLCTNSLMFISNVFSTQRAEFDFYLISAALRVVAIAIGIANENFLLAIALYAAAGTLIKASLLLWYLWQVRRYERTL
ncbi:MAG: oligosaccharide flippase family protein [Bacteroidaceae bacterium]|nr:oligosaccharide flippase family protein [Bacteroidaceae bacterium]